MDFMERDVAASLDAVFLHAAVGLAAVNLQDRCPGADLEFESTPGAILDDAIGTGMPVGGPGEQA